MNQMPSAFLTKQAVVYNHLRQQILHGELEPGHRLIIDDLAARFQVSAIPVREALQTLKADGLIVFRPHMGAVVASMSISAISEIFALMEALECAACRLAAPHVKPAHLSEMTALIQRMEDARGHSEEWSKANSLFHLAICSITEMPRISEMTARVFADWERLRRWFYEQGELPDLDQAHADHVAMVEALGRGDSASIESLTRRHNQNALQSYLTRPVRAPVKATREKHTTA
jgi:DNA-binding GntR family transcriptional regulator